MNRLWVRLSLGFSGVLLSAILLVALTGFLVNRTDEQVQQTEVLAEINQELLRYYQSKQSWQGSEPILEEYQRGFGHRRGPNWNFFLADAHQIVIYHPYPDWVGQPLNQVEQIRVVPIEDAGQTLGYLGLGRGESRGGERDNGALGFATFLGGTVLAMTLFVGVSGIVFGALMSRSLTAPLNNLATAAKSFGMRNLSQRVEEKGSDEMVAVARAFNEMAGELEQAEQLRRNLLADVAHELRTPISVLQANLRAILDEVYPLNQEEMVRLYDHSRLLGRLVNDLHELAQAEANQLSLDLFETDLRRLIQTTLDTFRLEAEEKEVTLRSEFPADLPPLKVDAARLTQVLQNLLANALRHTPNGGTITVGIEEAETGLRLSITDSGEGIPPEHLPHIFDRFYRIDPARSRDRGGAGLGLAITRAIVEAHDGQISVVSPGTGGQGSTFTIWLPK